MTQLSTNIVDHLAENKEYTTLNLGPTHPATHGIFQNILKMDVKLLLMLNLLWDIFIVPLKSWQKEDLIIKLHQ
jgi:hypothetical protein